MTIFQSIVLGLVQGLGEFLPISSSGHLVIIPWLFGFPDPGLSFDVALHFGTLLAVTAYFWKDWLNILKYSFKYLISKNKHETNSPSDEANFKLLVVIIIATVPGVIIGFLFDNLAENYFRNPLLIAAALFLAGLFLILADRKNGQKKLSALSFKDSLLIGLSQATAIIPGISRSGATIATGLFLGLNRVAAARFSFLLSAPIIFGATIFKFKYFFISGFGLAEFLGIAVSALSGFWAISFLLKFLEKSNYQIFFWYRTVLAILIILVFLARLNLPS